MLFDDRDLKVFENEESKTYFKEIVQLYYCQNYRASIVMLYSFVIYDLFIKLQTMESEGNHKAKETLKTINNMIKDDNKYSVVENTIIDFFKKNCELYFNKFTEDIEYLKNCRNKCSHLKVNDNSLFIPKDYQVRMLICSMYDNILSVKAPFITDLFSFVENEIDNLSNSKHWASFDTPNQNTINSWTEKYFKRMTDDSLKKSYKTVTRLLFISDDTECLKKIYGLYVVTYALTDYIVKKGKLQLFDITNIFSKITINTIQLNSDRKIALKSIMTDYPVLIDSKYYNEELFDYIRKYIFSKPDGLKYYNYFYQNDKKSVYTFFKETNELINPNYTREIYDSINKSNEFNFSEFLELMVKAIASFDSANNFMLFFIEHLPEITISDIKSVMKIYENNDQCYGRRNHQQDIEKVNKYIEEHHNAELQQ